MDNDNSSHSTLYRYSANESFGQWRGVVSTKWILSLDSDLDNDVVLPIKRWKESVSSDEAVRKGMFDRGRGGA